MYDSDNIFAKILRNEIPVEKVYEDDAVLAFHDISKAAPVHVLVIPKGAYISLDDFTQHATTEEIAHFFVKVQEIAALLEVTESGYRIVSNHGMHASQTVPHFHVHLLAGRPLGGLVPGDTQAR